MKYFIFALFVYLHIRNVYSVRITKWGNVAASTINFRNVIAEPLTDESQNITIAFAGVTESKARKSIFKFKLPISFFNQNSEFFEITDCRCQTLGFWTACSATTFHQWRYRPSKCYYSNRIATWVWNPINDYVLYSLK